MEALKLLTVDDLIVYALDDGTYRLCYSVAYRPPETPAQARIPPFESIDIDLGYIFGETQ
jgi:hypothetical protein